MGVSDVINPLSRSHANRVGVSLQLSWWSTIQYTPFQLPETHVPFYRPKEFRWHFCCMYNVSWIRTIFVRMTLACVWRHVFSGTLIVFTCHRTTWQWGIFSSGGKSQKSLKWGTCFGTHLKKYHRPDWKEEWCISRNYYLSDIAPKNNLTYRLSNYEYLIDFAFVNEIY